MEARQKNLLILGLITIVLVMSVGYAAFATQISIDSTSSITSKWDVHFDNTRTDTTPGVVDTTVGLADAAPPTGTITYASGDAPLSVTLEAGLNQPNDVVVFHLKIKNAGTLKATAATPVLTGSGLTIDPVALTATKGHIKFTVTAPSPTTINPNNSADISVTAEFTDTALNEVVNQDSATLTVDIVYTQAN